MLDVLMYDNLTSIYEGKKQKLILKVGSI